jgi:uncharacterized membrane protein YagU involved in acid resistance
VGIVAGSIGGIVDLVPTIAMQGAMGISPVRVLQAIASGVLGKSAYTGGLVSAAGGLVLHFAISIVCGLAFVLFAARVPAVRRLPLISGPIFGILVYVVMRYIVLPLSPVAFPLSSDPAVVAISLFFHAFLFGLPIAATVWVMTRPGSRASERV